mgnify:CR=1 FL=1
MEGLAQILPLILLVVVFYFLLIRPQRKRQQEMIRMQNSLTPGQRVMTTTGLFGTVVEVVDEDVVIEIAPGVHTRWVKGAIGRVVPEGEAVGVESRRDEETSGGDDADSSAGRS